VETGETIKIGAISPTAVRLTTYGKIGTPDRLQVWNAQNGQLELPPEWFDLPPLEIEFISDAEFHLNYDKAWISYTIHPWGRALRRGSITPSSQKKRCFGVDDAHEWVVKGSKKICWIPPGYIRSIQPNYIWAGSSLVMVGQDGILRKLAFSYDRPGE
jgi:hypothetical protein